MDLHTRRDPAPTVYVVDNDAATRAGLSGLLRQEQIRSRVYACGVEFLQDYGGEPGCVILDLRLPTMDGLQVLEALRRRGIEAPVIIVTGHGDVHSAVTSMKLGACDFLQKPVDPAALVQTVRAALAADERARNLREEKQQAARRIGRLTARERDLLERIVSGRANKQIAHDLGLSIKTVVNHRAHIMAKTGATNAADLTRMALVAQATRAERPSTCARSVRAA